MFVVGLVFRKGKMSFSCEKDHVNALPRREAQRKAARSKKRRDPLAGDRFLRGQALRGAGRRGPRIKRRAERHSRRGV